MIRALLDTNTLFSGIYKPSGKPGMILRLGFAGAFEACVTKPIMDELKDVLKRPRVRKLLYGKDATRRPRSRCERRRGSAGPGGHLAARAASGRHLASPWCPRAHDLRR